MSNWRFEDRQQITEFVRRTQSCPTCLEPMETTQYAMCRPCRLDWHADPVPMSMLVYVNSKMTNLCADCGDPCRGDDYLCRDCRG